jgi:hypothetical protein
MLITQRKPVIAQDAQPMAREVSCYSESTNSSQAMQREGSKGGQDVYPFMISLLRTRLYTEERNIESLTPGVHSIDATLP